MTNKSKYHRDDPRYLRSIPFSEMSDVEAAMFTVDTKREAENIIRRYRDEGQTLAAIAAHLNDEVTNIRRKNESPADRMKRNQETVDECITSNSVSDLFS